MTSAQKELEDRLQEVGNQLASPPSAIDELLPLLDQTESFLARVEQSPSESMSNALHPAMKALVAKEFLGHSDTDVKVAVASCISEITRITAPDAPYDDDLMKEVFQKIVGSFEKLDDISSRSYSKRVSILETVAKVRSCVVMLDLECDALILEMFRHFLCTIREFLSNFSKNPHFMLSMHCLAVYVSAVLILFPPNHSENVFNSMETIMTLVLEESEDISTELLTCLLDTVKKDNKEISPIARRLGEKVMSNCTMKLKPYMKGLLNSMSASLSQFSKIVGSICHENSDGMEQKDANVSGEGSAKMEQEVGCAEEVGTAADKSPKSVMSNGTVQIGNGESVVEPASPKQRPGRSHRNGQSKSTSAANRADADNLESFPAKPESSSDLNTRKIRGRATDNSRIDSDKEAPALPSRRKDRGKEADTAQFDGSSGKVADLAKMKDEILPHSGSDNGTGGVASPDHSESPDATQPRRGRPSGSRISSKRGGGHGQHEALPLKDVDSKKELEGSGDSEGKSSRRSSRKHPRNVDDGETPTTVTSDSETKPQRQTSKKTSTRRVTNGDSSRKQLKFNVKQKKAENDVAREVKLKGSGTPAQSTVLDENLVGSRIKVWWPDDKAFYDGVVDSFDPVSKKHKILYDDGDIEVLLLKNERWKLVRIDEGLAKDISSPDASSELRRDKKANTSSSSVSKHSKMETPVKSDVLSSSVAKRKGRPRGGMINPGKLSSDYSPKISGKSKEDASKHDDDIPKTGSRIKKDTGSKSKDDTLKTGDKSTDETSKTDSKSRDDTQKAGSKSRVDVPKSSRKLKSEDDMISTGGRAKKEAVRGKSSEETLRSGRKFKGESRANGTSEKGKSKAEEIETYSGKVQSDSVKVQESEASTGKKRKRKGQS
ncbi:putative abhydrolase domain-containing protein [Cocos nucifera]|uniref:Putative abhydrolase domain-containing protein n=1 Tax=Cocos nucifera TaxID=13894 RepID=A0A8K0NA09_COCNU|nr:putative abhydrolase domain-containing protein [Cocos nucifera]